MPNSTHLRLPLWLGVLLVGLTGCLKDNCENTQTLVRLDPVYLTAGELRQEIEVEGPRALQRPGKIYYYQDYLFVNEMEEGIHIIDNKDPKNPVMLSFIRIPGNVDMAVRGNMLYADNYVDLVTMDISDPRAPSFVSRTESVFPGFGFDPARGFIVNYTATETTQQFPCDQSNNWMMQRGGVIFAEGGWFTALDAANAGRPGMSTAQSAAAAALGIGGSMARFTIGGEFLYTVDQSSIHVFNLADPARPVQENSVGIGWAIETIFPYQGNLFIGSQSGMFIYNLRDPRNPAFEGVFQHANACDPVFVDGNLAYVTLRDGTECQDFNNQLDVVDVSTLNNPRLLYSYPMHHPIGLSVSKGHLYLCEDDQGVKVFDVADPARIDENQVAHLKGFTAYDIITLGSRNIALVIGKDGLYQFDIADPGRIDRCSVIPVAE